MSETTTYDLLTLYLVDASKVLSEANHPKADVLKNFVKDAYLLISNAAERLRAVKPSVEDQQLLEFLRYATTALTKVYVYGDWRPYVFMNELFNEVPPFKTLQERLINMAALTPKSRVGEINSITPLTSSRLASRLGGEQFLLLEKTYLENSLFREILEEYSRRYSSNSRIISLDMQQEVEKLTESLDLLYTGTIDAWKLGWSNILAIASRLIKRKGYFTAILPATKHLAMRTLLSLFDVPDYPDTAQIKEELQKMRFTNIYISSAQGFTAFFAIKR
ncbi:MAG: hypothetical protein ABWK01_09110 [Infirmifilum sp.]